MSTVTKITISKARLFADLPAWNVDGVWWDGFTSLRGVVFVCAEDGQAWIEHHGDLVDLVQGGHVIGPGDGDHERMRFNLFPAGQRQRLDDDPALIFAAVNRAKVAAGRTAVTAFQERAQILCPRLRLEGPTYSTTVKPPIRTRPEPLNFWVETRERMEVL